MTPITNRDLTREAPHSPSERFGGFAILGRTVDKCRASQTGKLGEYHYDCPLDNQLFGFKGINGGQFKNAIASARNYEDIAAWLRTNGTPKTPDEIKAWSDKVETAKLKDVFAKRSPADVQEVQEHCRKLGLDFESATLFEWLETDDRASFQPHAEMAHK